MGRGKGIKIWRRMRSQKCLEGDGYQKDRTAQLLSADVQIVRGQHLNVGQFPRVGQTMSQSLDAQEAFTLAAGIYRVLSKRDKTREAASIRSPTKQCYKSQGNPGMGSSERQAGGQIKEAYLQTGRIDPASPQDFGGPSLSGCKVTTSFMSSWSQTYISNQLDFQAVRIISRND